MLEKIAKANGYSSIDQLLMDYGFMPTVLTPKHKKVEIVKAIAKSFTNKKVLPINNRMECSYF